MVNSSAPSQVYKPQKLLSVDLNLNMLRPPVKVIERVEDDQLMPNGDVMVKQMHQVVCCHLLHIMTLMRLCCHIFAIALVVKR